MKIEARHIVVSINAKVAADWTRPEDWDREKNLKGTPDGKFGEGTITIKGHGPKSVVHDRDLFIRPWP